MKGTVRGCIATGYGQLWLAPTVAVFSLERFGSHPLEVPDHKASFQPRKVTGLKHLMHGTDKEARAARAAAVSTEQWPGIDSSFRLIVVAAQRNKQLTRGALPRVEADPRRRRNTSIALEEVRRGLVPFTDIPKVRARGGAGDGAEADE